MHEREVTKKVAERLRVEGVLDLVVQFRNEKGPDIKAGLPGSRRWLYVEAKGERKDIVQNQTCRSALGEALVQVLSVYDKDVVCAIAVPYSEDYSAVVRTIMPGLRRLGLHVLLVKDEETWQLAADGPGFLPSISESVVGVLDA